MAKVKKPQRQKYKDALNSIALVTGCFALCVTVLLNLGDIIIILQTALSTFNFLSFPTTAGFKCLPQHYTTEIISIDPLLIYIQNFVNPQDIEGLLELGENRFIPSEIYQNGQLIRNPYRSSLSAPLPSDDAAVSCVLGRAQGFLGTMLDPSADEMGVPQLVRYTAGQEYNLHHDWLRIPQRAFDGSPRSFNRIASFFVILQDNCTGGETWFPHVRPATSQKWGRAEGRLWWEHEDGGLAFKPVVGNSLFWVNFLSNGTADSRTVHAGLPVTGGLKTAM
ncbi:uncharacterized protein BCR38DRAFT_429332, partial [Pseudomassariella vexata]